MPSVNCPACSRKLTIRSESVGGKVKCPECSRTFRIPAPAAPEPEEETSDNPFDFQSARPRTQVDEEANESEEKAIRQFRLLPRINPAIALLQASAWMS